VIQRSRTDYSHASSYQDKVLKYHHDLETVQFDYEEEKVLFSSVRSNWKDGWWHVSLRTDVVELQVA
jgi:hypothetical protein